MTAMAPDPRLIKVEQCWICSGTDLATWSHETFDMTWQVDPILRSYHEKSFNLNRCSDCGFVQPESLPPESDFFDRLYSLDRGPQFCESEYVSTDRDLVFKTVLDDLAHRLSPDRRRLLDVGCADGRLLRYATDAGWVASGIELNPAKAAFAERMTGRPVHQLNAKQFAATGETFDAITLNDVLEHIPEPMHVLRDLRKILSPGGWIAVKLPNGRNQWRKERLKEMLTGQPTRVSMSLTHVNQFSPPTLKLALERAGFANATVGVAAPELFAASSGTSRLLRRVVYKLAKLPGGTRSPLTLNLQAYAQNPA